MKTIIISLILSNISFVFISCSRNKKQTDSGYKQYNITILLDLSDRIEPSKNPDQIDRDKEIIKTVLNTLKSNVQHKGTFNSFDKFRVMFYPQPTSSHIADLATNLNFDLGILEPKQKKQLFLDLDNKINENLDLLYSAAVKNGAYQGSDLWRFFKDEVKEKCIVDKSNYQNYLIVLTDGYVYWKYTQNSVKNRFTWILANSNQVNIFRNDPYWINRFDKEDYGFISTGVDLASLKVLVLEVNPVKQFPQDYDIIKKYLDKWFNEMHMNEGNYKILKTDVPTYTKPIITSFLNSN